MITILTVVIEDEREVERVLKDLEDFKVGIVKLED